MYFFLTASILVSFGLFFESNHIPASPNVGLESSTERGVASVFLALTIFTYYGMREVFGDGRIRTSSAHAQRPQC